VRFHTRNFRPILRDRTLRAIAGYISSSGENFGRYLHLRPADGAEGTTETEHRIGARLFYEMSWRKRARLSAEQVVNLDGAPPVSAQPRMSCGNREVVVVTSASADSGLNARYVAEGGQSTFLRKERLESSRL
jgi:hypothetical protein